MPKLFMVQKCIYYFSALITRMQVGGQRAGPQEKKSERQKMKEQEWILNSVTWRIHTFHGEWRAKYQIIVEQNFDVLSALFSGILDQMSKCI